jgi:hypothetical protein
MEGSQKTGFHAVVLGALIHDIGRFVQITKGKPPRFEPNQTDNFINFPLGKYTGAFPVQRKGRIPGNCCN